MKRNNIINLAVIVIATTMLTFSCETTEPPPSNQKLTITAEDASCTEAWLNLKIENISLPTEIVLKQNDTTIITNINSSDTTIFIENLRPSQTYTFQAASIQQQVSRHGGQASNKVTVITMDTTSHNFTWESFTFGGGNSSSYLMDVAIINENDIWAVGEIHTEDTDQFDSNGVWVQPYNAVHWDGNKWELKRIMFYVDQDQPSAGKTPSQCESAFVFDENEFAITSNVQTALFKPDGSYELLKMGFQWEDRFTINAMWGTSSSDFYVVGNGGNIAHYNGSPSADGWRKLESGTELDIRDIYGSFNFNTGEREILCIASNKYFNEDSELIQILNGKAIKLPKEGLPWSLSGIWFVKNRKYFIAGDGLFSSTGLNNIWKEEKGSPRLYKDAVRGTKLNNIVVSGAYGLLSHFNGVTWHHYVYAELPYLSGSYSAVDINDRIIVTVGYKDTKAIIVIGEK